MKTEAPDAIQMAVLNTVDAIQDGDRSHIEAALEALSELTVGDVIAEVFLSIEELTEGVSEAVLLESVVLPIPARPESILKAVRRTSLPQLLLAVRSLRPEKTIAPLLVLLAALKDARERL